MSLLNKSFKDNISKDTIKVIGINENIASLNNGEKVAASRLLDQNYYTEVIDPNSFFSSDSTILDSILGKIKSIPTDNMIDDISITKAIVANNNQFNPANNESVVSEISDEDARAELMAKYKNSYNEPIKTIDPEDYFIPPVQPPIVKTPVQPFGQQPEYNPPTQHVMVEDPIIAMFKGVKRNVDFNVSFDIVDKIPRIDFIEMMEDSYNVSIIDFLAEEFTNKLLSDPSTIKKTIKDNILKLVNGGSKPKTDKPNIDRPTPIVESKTKGNVKATNKEKQALPPPPVPPKDRIIKEGKTPRKPKAVSENKN